MAYYEPIGLLINGLPPGDLPTPPVILNGSTLVPARAVFESLGAEVEWQDCTQTVYIQYQDKNIVVTIDEYDITVNGETAQMPIPAKILNSSTMIPLRAVAENLGFYVDFMDRTVFVAACESHMPIHPTTILSVDIPAINEPQIFTITASSAITDVETMLLFDDRLVLDIPNSTTALRGSFNIRSFLSVRGIRASQFAENVSRVVFDLYAETEYSVELSECRTMIVVTVDIDESAILNAQTFRNIRYDFESNTLSIPRTDGFTMDNLLHSDLYLQRQYILTLPQNASEHLGYGEFRIFDNLLRSVMIEQTSSGNTQLIFNGARVISVDLQEDEEYYHIRIILPRERYSRIVVLDPGHGGRDPGAVRNGVRESDINLIVAFKVAELLENEGSVRVYMTRDTDVYVSLGERARFSNEVGDIFVSIHHNAASNIYAHGVETFYLESVSDNSRTLTNRKLADIMQRQLLYYTGRNDREVRRANFSVLRNTTSPATLVEIGFMSNSYELAAIVTPEYQWKASYAIFYGILEAFELYAPSR